MTPLPVVVFNDTTRDRGHLGCETVMATIERLCAANGMEVVRRVPERRLSDDDIRRHLEGARVAIVNGEGSLHSGRPIVDVMMRVGELARERGVTPALVNAQWHDNPPRVRELERFAMCSFRDEASLREAGTTNGRHVADLLLHASNRPTAETRTRDLLVVDSVLKPKTAALYEDATRAGAPFRVMCDRNERRLPLRWPLVWARRRLRGLEDGNLAMRDVATARFLVTGRFHAMLAAVQCRTPFLALESNTPKISRFVRDAGLPRECVGTFADLERARAAWESFDWSATDAFVSEQSRRTDRLFADIRRAADEDACGAEAAAA